MVGVIARIFLKTNQHRENSSHPAPGIVTMGPVIPWGEMGCGNDGDLAELGVRKYMVFSPAKVTPYLCGDPM